MDKYDKHYNQMITFTIIREMWKAFREMRPSETFYEAMHIDRKNYSRYVNETGIYPRTETRAKKLSENMGIDENIFKGIERVHIEGISDKEWEIYFENKAIAYAKEEEQDKDARKNVQEFEQKLRKQLNLIKNDEADYCEKNLNIYKIFFWVQYKTKFEGTTVKIQVTSLGNALEKLTFNKLKEVPLKELNEYLAILENHLRKVNAAKVYQEELS